MTGNPDAQQGGLFGIDRWSSDLQWRVHKWLRYSGLPVFFVFLLLSSIFDTVWLFFTGWIVCAFMWAFDVILLWYIRGADDQRRFRPQMLALAIVLAPVVCFILLLAVKRS